MAWTLEMQESGTYRQSFFEKMKAKAEKVFWIFCIFSFNYPTSPQLKPLPQDFNPQEMAKQIYDKCESFDSRIHR